MTEIRPGAFRVKIQPSPVDTDDPREPGEGPPQFGSRKPRGTQPDRGVVIEVGPGVVEDSEDEDRWGFLREGAVVYYKGGFVLDGYVYCEVTHDTIVAYEG